MQRASRISIYVSLGRVSERVACMFYYQAILAIFNKFILIVMSPDLLRLAHAADNKFLSMMDC